jgi:hypothetical protein
MNTSFEDQSVNIAMTPSQMKLVADLLELALSARPTLTDNQLVEAGMLQDMFGDIDGIREMTTICGAGNFTLGFCV